MTQDAQFSALFLPPEQNRFYKKRQKKNLSRLGIALVLHLLLTKIVARALKYAVAWLAPQYYYSQLFLWILNIVPPYCVALPITCLALWGMPKKKPEKRKLSFENKVAFLSISFFLTQVGFWVAEILMSFIESLRNTQITNEVNSFVAAAPQALLFVATVLLAPLAEEWIFRKLLIDRLLPYSEVLAVVASAVLFGLAHGNFYQFFYAALLGALFAIIYIKTGTLRHTILMHMLLNFTGSMVVSFFASVTSQDAMLTSSINPWILIYGLYRTAIFLLSCCGLLFMLRKRKELKLSHSGEVQLSLKTQQILFWSSLGSILFLLLSVVNFINKLYI